jgi:hypothetical protein
MAAFLRNASMAAATDSGRSCSCFSSTFSTACLMAAVLVKVFFLRERLGLAATFSSPSGDGFLRGSYADLRCGRFLFHRNNRRRAGRAGIGTEGAGPHQADIDHPGNHLTRIPEAGAEHHCPGKEQVEQDRNRHRENQGPGVIFHELRLECERLHLAACQLWSFSSGGMVTMPSLSTPASLTASITFITMP